MEGVTPDAKRLWAAAGVELINCELSLFVQGLSDDITAAL
jgi:hypothetical protein